MQGDENFELRGPYSCTLDEKGRLKIPAPFRRAIPAELFKTLIISMGKERCLNLYTRDEFEKILKDLASRPKGPERRDIQRFFSLASKQLKVDGKGRVAIPPDFLATLENPREIVVLGVGKYLELWTVSDFEDVSKRVKDTYLKSDFEG